MPFKSKAQEGYMHVHHPEIAERWDKETPSPKELPEHVEERKSEHEINKENRAKDKHTRKYSK